MTEAIMTEAWPLQLLIWLSPAFPVGSFACSHGLEWAVGSGAIADRGHAEAWLRDLVTAGGPRNDTILLAAAWHAITANDMSTLLEVNDLALALAGSRERYLETSTQGNAFMVTLLAAWQRPDLGPALSDTRAALAADVAYPVAVGIAAGVYRLALLPTLQSYAIAGTGNLCSALVRLGAIGQTDAQRIQAALLPVLLTLADAAGQSTLDDLGGAAFGSDLAAIAHETQDTRLFRS